MRERGRRGEGEKGGGGGDLLASTFRPGVLSLTLYSFALAKHTVILSYVLLLSRVSLRRRNSPHTAPPKLPSTIMSSPHPASIRSNIPFLHLNRTLT